MAIFNHSDNAPTPNNNNTTIITEGSFIKGEMKLDCNLYIDGEFEGTILSKKLVTIGKSGKVRGEIHTNHLIVQGLVEGSIDADRLEIMAAGSIVGSILSAELVIEAKGHFEGESKIKSKDSKNKAVNTSFNEKKKEA
ncbi:polymer-forming cytoskeletal protein [Sulfurimonas sp. MAG313]|nr:polymer-forming cytoskeletal protein [Sulfurimonas sp. MAG313]MDF1881911.1 polymer-forming cytoskeletal protein [Sulfurimonas sp. MAG313]